MSSYHPPSLGWRQSLGDFRDFRPHHPQVQQLFREVQPAQGSIPKQMDLREFFPEVRQQGPLNSSSVHACLSLLEYFERRSLGHLIEPSRMFVYHGARALMRAQGDSGSDLRTVLKSLAIFGVPAEVHWPYELANLDVDPPAYLYCLARRYRSLVYVRLDDRNGSGVATLAQVRRFLAAGFPVVFGFPVPSSLSAAGDIPYRPMLDSVQGGQAVVATGYDDERAGSTRGALQFRNSWGLQWGESGYGWLPYRYVEEQLATEFWTILGPQWLQSDEFVRPASCVLDGPDPAAIRAAHPDEQ